MVALSLFRNNRAAGNGGGLLLSPTCSQTVSAQTLLDLGFRIQGLTQQAWWADAHALAHAIATADILHLQCGGCCGVDRQCSMPFICIATSAMKVVMVVTDVQHVLCSYHSLLVLNAAER